jgi:hypothetical protein
VVLDDVVEKLERLKRRLRVVPVVEQAPDFLGERGVNVADVERMIPA